MSGSLDDSWSWPERYPSGLPGFIFKGASGLPRARTNVRIAPNPVLEVSMISSPKRTPTLAQSLGAGGSRE